MKCEEAFQAKFRHLSGISFHFHLQPHQPTFQMAFSTSP